MSASCSHGDAAEDESDGRESRRVGARSRARELGGRAHRRTVPESLAVCWFYSVA